MANNERLIKAMRFDMLDFLNVGTEGEEEWALMQGYTQLDFSTSAQTETEAYIHDKASTTTITGYEPSFSFESDRIINDKANKMLYDIGNEQKTGSDAEVEYLRVDMLEKAADGAANEYKAKKYLCAVEVTDISGEPMQKQKVSGSLHQCGNFISGKFNTETKVFTPDDAGE